MNRPEIYQAIDEERGHQDRKWGTIDQRPHEVGAYLTLMRKLLTEAEFAWAGNRGDEGALDELRKVVAVGVACMEQHGMVKRSVLSKIAYPEPETKWKNTHFEGGEFIR
jgi:hypothetical protein